MRNSSRCCVLKVAGLAGLFSALNLCGQVDVPRNFIAVSNAPVTGSATLNKVGAGLMSFVGPSGNTFSGDIDVGVDGGTMRIGGSLLYLTGTERAGTALPNMTSANTITVRRGGIFEIKDNANGAFGYIPNRLGSEGERPDLTLDGGTFVYNGAAVANTLMTQSVGVVTIASGAATIAANRTTSGTPVLLGDSFIRTPGAFISFIGPTLGSAAINVPKILFGTVPDLVGAAGAEGTKTMSLLTGARFGNDWVTYGANGVRALVAAEYNEVAGNNINLAGATENVKFTLTTTPPALSGPKTVNSLVQIMTATPTWAMGNTLTLTSGQLLNSRAWTISSGALTAGAGDDAELHFISINSTTMAGNIVDNMEGAIKLVKSGASSLTLSTTTDNTYSGGTVVNEGSLITFGATANRRFFGTGPVRVDNAILTMTAIGATANNLGDDYTAVNAAQITLPTTVVTFTGGDTFNIGAGSVIAGPAASGSGLNSLDRGRNDSSMTNITLATDAIIAHPALGAPLNLNIGTVKNLGADADLFYGLNAAQANDAGVVTIGSGTPFKGISSTRASQVWQRGKINVAAGTIDFYLQGLALPSAVTPGTIVAPTILTLGNNALTVGAPVIDLAESGSVNAQVLNNVTLDDNASIFGDAVNKLNFVVNSGATLTVNQTDALGSGSGIATAQVKDGGTLMIGSPAGINSTVTVEAGGRILANNPGGLTGTGAIVFNEGSVLDINHTAGFNGLQAASATVEPGTIVRLNIANFGSATDPLDNYFIGKSPIFELFGNNWHVNPVAANTTILTLNRGENGKGGMLVNRDATTASTVAPNGVLAIGPNGGVIAATMGTTLTMAQPIALSSNELVIGSTEMIDRIMAPKLGIVALTAPSGYSMAEAGSKISIIPGAQLNNAANSLPDLAEVAVDGIFNVAGSDTIGSLSGTGLVSMAANTLTVGRNDADATFDGRVVATTGKFVKTGAGRLDLTGTNVFSTGTVRVNDDGELALSGGGVLPNTGTAAFTLADGGVLHLDNSEVNLDNRLTGAAAGVTFQGGTFRFTGKDGEASGESLGAATFAFGSSTIEIVNGAGEGSSSEVVFSALTANPPGTVNFSGQNGILGSAGDNPRVRFNGLAAGLVGYGRVGDALAFNDTTYGIRAFTLAEGTEFDGTSTTQNSLNTVFTTNNVNPTMGAAKIVNSLWIDNPGDNKFVDLGTGAFNLTLGSGRLLLTGTNDFEVKRGGTGTLTGTPTYLYLGVDDPDTTLTVSVPLAKPFEKDGAGTLVLDAPSTFTTGITVNEGTVKYGAAGDLAATWLTTQNGGIFDLAGKTDTLGALTLYSGGVTNSVPGGVLTISTLSFGTTAIGAGPAAVPAFVETGSGTLRLGGTVTYNVINDPKTAVISGNLDLNGTTRSFVVGDSVSPGAYIDLDVPAAITGGAGVGITKTGTGTMRLGGNNTFDGPVVAAGTLRLNHPKALGNPSVARVLTLGASTSLVLDGSNGDIAIPANYTPVSLSSANTFVGPISGSLVNWSGNNSISGAVVIAATQIASLKAGDKLTLTGNMTGNVALTVDGSGDTELSGTRTATSAGTLIKNGSGTLTLSGSGANTFSGATTVNAGTLILNKSGGAAASASTVVTVNNGATLRYGAGTQNALATPAVTINGSGILDMNGATDTIGALAFVGNAAASAATSDTTPLINTAGGGNLTVTTLGITPAPGYLSWLDTGSGTLRIGGNLTFAPVTTGRARISGNLALGAATRTIATGNFLAAPDFELDIDAAISGSAGAGIIKTGTGTLRLGGANTFDGPVTVAGIVTLRDPQALGLPSTSRLTTVPSGSTLAFDGVGISDPNNRITISVNGTGSTRLGLVSGVLANLAGTNEVPCAITLTGTSRFASLKAGDKLTLSGGIVGNAALTVDGEGDMELSGDRSSTTTAATLIKNGTGTLTLSGNNSFTGNSTINAGILRVAATNSLSTSTLVTVANGGTLEPGAFGAAGSTTFINRLTLAVGSAVGFEFAEGVNDQIIVTGAAASSLTLTGGGVYLYAQGTTDPWTKGGRYDLFKFNSTLGGNVANLSVLNPQPNKVYTFVAAGGWVSVIITDPTLDQSWDGGSSADSNWMTAENWSSDLTPDPVSVLTFAGTTRLAATNDYPANTPFSGLIFDDTAGAFTLDGNTVNLLGDVASSNANAQTINLPLVLDLATRTFNVGDADMVLNGAISETAANLGLVKTGGGMLRLLGLNTFSGPVTIQAGTLNAQNDGALGTLAGGVSVANGGALALEGGVTIGAEAITLNGMGVSGDGALRNIDGANTLGGLITLASDARIQSDAGTLRLDPASGSAIAGTGRAVTFGGEGDIVVAKLIATGAAGSLTKVGSGVLTLSAANNFTGPTRIEGGKIRATTVVGALGGAGQLQMAGGAVDFANDANLSISKNAVTVSQNAAFGTDRLNSSGAGVIFTLGTLAIGGQNLDIVGGGLVNSGIAGITFGVTTLEGSPNVWIANPPNGGTTRLSLGAITGNGNSITLDGNGNFIQSGVWGAGAGGLNLRQSYTGLALLSQANLFTNGCVIKGGTLAGTVASAFGAAANGARITLGDTFGSTDATLMGSGAGPFAQPITVTGGNTGRAIITNNAASTFSGAVTLDNHDLIVSPFASALALSGGMSGTGNLWLRPSGAGTLTLSVNPVDIAGTIVNQGTGVGLVTISGGIGANVTSITESSTNSALTISTAALTVNENGTTLVNENPSGIRVLTLLAPVTGTGDLILRNNSDILNGITVSSASINHEGRILSLGTGTGNTLLSGILGANVAGVIQNSPTSMLTMSGNSVSYTGGLVIRAGTVWGTTANSFGTGDSTITIGDTTGSADAILMGLTTYTRPIIIAGGNTGRAIITNSATAVFSGPLSMNNHDLLVSPAAAALTLSGGITGAGTLRLKANGIGGIGLATFPVNHQGTIISDGEGAGVVTISGGVGANVTAITQSSTNSALTISTVSASTLTVNPDGTTLSNDNPGGTRIMTVSAPIVGTGDLILRNNSAILNGIFVSGAPNHAGRIINAGTGAGNVRITGTIGSNVTNVLQESESSVLEFANAAANNTFAGGVLVESNRTIRIAQTRFDRNATGPGAVDILAGGTVEGNGLMAGTVILNGGGTLSPSVNNRTAGGKLMLGGLDWQGGGVFDCVVTKIESAVGGTHFGQLIVNGNLNAQPGDTNLIIRLDSRGETLAYNPGVNYGLKLIGFNTAGMATNLNLATVQLDTNAFLVAGGTWSLTNLFNSIYLVSMGAPPSPDVNVWIAPGAYGLDWDYWSNSNNWSLGRIPLDGDDVLFDFFSTINCRVNPPITNAVGSITVAEGYGGRITFWTAYPTLQAGFTDMRVTGDFTMRSGTIDHLDHTGYISDIEVYRLSLSVGGNFTVGPNASVNLDGQGFPNSRGPGAGLIGASALGRGASHGGEGENKPATSSTYGSITQPENLGSGAAGSGGGALFLRVGGTATIDGLVSAQGTGGSATTCPGAGGSIFIRAGQVEGSGTIRAGVSTNLPAFYGSGGGRIAVIATNGATLGSVTFRANPHTQAANGGGRAGTVYLETTEFKRLIVDQESIGTAAAQYTYLPAPTETFETIPAIGGALEDVTLIVTNGAFIKLGTDLRLGDFAWLDGSIALDSRTLYLKAAAPSGAFPADYGAGTVSLPGVFFTFANSDTITRDGRLLWGDEGTTWRVLTLIYDNAAGSVTNKGYANEQYIAHGSSLEIEATEDYLDFRFWDGAIPDGKPSSTDNPLIVASLDRHSAFRAWFVDTIVNQQFNTWLPATADDDWFAPYNWDLLMVPVAGQHITIPAGSTVRLSSSTPALGTFTIENGATLTFDGWNTALEGTTLTIEGRLTHLEQNVISTNGLGLWVPQHRIWLKGQNLVIAATGMLDADGKGYGPGMGPGRAPTQPYGGDQGYGYGTGGGGGYGGYGAISDSQVNGPAYGEPNDPWQPGSGGGYRAVNYGYNARPAGGAIRVDMTGGVTVDGLITARGQNAAGTGGAGGSGGGIAIYCQTLTGATSGWVRADGANGVSTGGSGGGGRIALHYAPAAQAALPNPRPPIRISAAAGLNHTPAYVNVLPVMGTLYMPDTTLLAASPTGASVLDGHRFWYTRLYMGSHSTSWSPASLHIENCVVGFPDGYTLDIGGNLTLVGSMAPLSATERAGLHLFATSNPGLYGSSLRVGGHFAIGENTWYYPHTDGFSATIVGTRVGGDFTVAAGGGVNADIDGYRPTRDNSNGPGVALGGQTGGSYGGWGGSTNLATMVTNGVPRPPYGLSVMPLEAGSPGSWRSYGNDTGSARGGGAIHVLAGGNMTIDGLLTANGGNGVYYSGNGGSGGSIFLSSRRLIGTGTMRASGGRREGLNYTSHPGGGGRIAVWQYQTLSSAQTRVDTLNIQGLTQEVEMYNFSGVVDVNAGTYDDGATAGTAEFYTSRTFLFIVR